MIVLVGHIFSDEVFHSFFCYLYPWCMQETTSSSEEQEEEAAKISLPVLCQEDGKTVLRFSKLFGVREPY